MDHSVSGQYRPEGFKLWKMLLDGSLLSRWYDMKSSYGRGTDHDMFIMPLVSSPQETSRRREDFGMLVPSIEDNEMRPLESP